MIQQLKKIYQSDAAIFGMLFLIGFMLYYPAAQAGWVYDTVGWLYNVQHENFIDFLNRTESGIPSLYHFTQFLTYVYYHIVGINAWAWHLLMLLLHTTNAWLLYIICRQLFHEASIKNAQHIAIGGALLFTICPHISECIVWEAAFHYLLGFLFILIIMRLVQLYHQQPKTKYIWFAAITFFLSSYSLEVFYLTPGFVLSLALYYRFALKTPKLLLRKSILLFVLPQIIIYGAHLAVLYMVYGHFAHIAESIVQPIQNYLVKPPKYIFHLFLLGRYWPDVQRQLVYHVLNSNQALIAFYSLSIIAATVTAFRFKKLNPTSKVAILLTLWTLFALVIITPLVFPEMQLVFFDRYAYILCGFAFMLMALIANRLPGKFTALITIAVFGACNIYFTMRINNYWLQSAAIERNLLHNLPDAGNKTILLLNLPENLNGIPMISSSTEGEYKKQQLLLTGKTIPNEIYDVASYNMQTDGDGVNVTVLNDSTLKVSLTKWGSWWQLGNHGAQSYENKAFKLNMVDMGRWYLITLKQPPQNYLLLYQVGDHWRTVDMTKKDVLQE